MSWWQMISEQFYIFPCYLFQLRETRWISFLVQLQRQQNHLSQITEVHDTKDLGKAGGEVKLIIHLLQCVCRVYNRLMWWWSDSWPCMGRCSIFIESTLFQRIPRINPFLSTADLKTAIPCQVELSHFIIFPQYFWSLPLLSLVEVQSPLWP